MALFNGFELKRGDKDIIDSDGKPESRYAGKKQESGNPFVERLQKLLKELGFGIVGEPDGSFGLQTEMAVREFQIYAACKRVAQLDTKSQAANYHDTLIEKELETVQRYISAGNGPLPATGVVNKRTGELLELWKTQKLRCPLVISAFGMEGKGHDAHRTTKVHAFNIWRHNEINDPKPRMYARDFSDEFRPLDNSRQIRRLEVLSASTATLQFDGNKKELDFSLATTVDLRAALQTLTGVTDKDQDLEVTGPDRGPWEFRFSGDAIDRNETDLDKFSALNGTGSVLLRKAPAWEEIGDFSQLKDRSGGPRSDPRSHNLQEEILPKNFMWRAINTFDLEDQERITFRVLRAVAETECVGYFDSVNAFDNAVVSLGPCHWTFALRQKGGGVAEGELAGFLAYYRKKSPDEFERTFGRFGLRPSIDWGNDGQNLFNGSLRTYSKCWWSRPVETGSAFGPVPRTASEANYYRSWHWFYRWVMAGRTRTHYQRLMYDMARFRLREVMTAKWKDGLFQKIGGREAQIGDVFSSEALIALLFRWHINQPAYVLKDGQAHPLLEKILVTAGLSGSNINIGGVWTQQIHQKLVEALFDTIGTKAKHLIATLPNVAARAVEDEASSGKWTSWPKYPGRDSYQFDLEHKGTDPEDPIATLPLSRGRNTFQLHKDKFGIDPTAPFDAALHVPLPDPIPDLNRTTIIPEFLLLIPAEHKDGSVSDEEPKPKRTPGLGMIGKPLGGGKQRIDAIAFTALEGGATIEEDPSLPDNLKVGKLPNRLFGFVIPVKTPPELELELGDPPDDPDKPESAGQDLVQLCNTASTGAVKVGDVEMTPDAPLGGDGRLVSRQVTKADTLQGKRFKLDLAKVLGEPTADADIAGLAADAFNAELVFETVAPPKFTARVDVTLDHVVLPRPFRWSFALSSEDLDADAKPEWFRFAMPPEAANIAAVDLRSGAAYDQPERVSAMAYGLPLVLDAVAAVHGLSAQLRLSLDADGALRPELEVQLKGQVGVDLGSPLARLQLGTDGATAVTLRYSPEQGIAVDLPEKLDIDLKLDLFDRYQGSSAVVNNVWASAGVTAEIDPKWLLSLKGKDQGSPSEQPRAIRWRDGYPQIDPTRFVEWFNDAALPEIDEDRRLRSLAGRVLGQALPTNVSFEPCASRDNTSFEFDGDKAILTTCLRVNVKGNDTTETLLSADGKFKFLIDALEDGRLALKPGSLRCIVETIVTTHEDHHSKFGEMVSLHVPTGTAFRLVCDPREPKLEWLSAESRKQTPKRIAVRVPASETGDFDKEEERRLTFDIAEFAIHSAGIDLRASARAERVLFGKDTATGFAGPIAVRPPAKSGKDHPPGVGELAFKNSKLVAGSVQASAKLRYFDDATGTLTLNLSQDDHSGSLDCAGSLDIAGVSEFRVAQLFALFRLTAFNLGIKYSSGEWKSDARLTGRIEFTPPPGRSSSEVREMRDLFSGVTVDFEDLNLLNLGDGGQAIRLDFPPKRFKFAGVMGVDLRALTVVGQEIALEGDLTLTNLPGADSSLTLSDITLEGGQEGFGPPDFRVGRIGASFDVPGGFHLDGEFQFVEFEHETGFVGAFAVVSETLPRMGGIVKLTQVRARDGELVPSVAVFVEADYDAPLYAGFYLRSLGVGIGIFQALRGLEPSEKPLQQKIVSLVDNPKGLPEPRQVESWVPARPNTRSGPLNWMLVGTGLITYGKLERDEPHPFAGSILLSIDQDLQIVAGVNLWLFASPEETRDPAFIQRPAGRGALGISVKERRVFALFRTLPRPKLGQDTPKLLGEVLSRVETTLLFSADPNGLLLEVGWPWQTKIGPYRIGPLEGLLTAGFRFGLYRGVTTFGLNYSIAVKLAAEAEWGFSVGRFGSARAVIGVEGEGLFRASFVGALDRDFSTYLVGDVRLATTVRLYAAAEASFSLKISRWIKIKKTIRFRRTLDLAVSAALTAAMDNRARVGFQGRARVAVSICGYRLSGKVAFEHDVRRIAETRAAINKLLPPRILPGSAKGLGRQADIPEASNWQYRFRRFEDSNGNRVVRVLLFPEPGLEYPRPEDGKDRFELVLKDTALERGTIASTALTENIDAAQSDITVDDSSRLSVPDPFEGFRITIGDEEMEVTGVSGNTLTVKRGVDGTTAAAASAATNVARILSPSDTRIAVDGGSGFPAVPFDIRIGDEHMRVTGRNGDLFTVERGRNFSVAESHVSGAEVQQVQAAPFVGFVGVASEDQDNGTRNFRRVGDRLVWNEDLEHLIDEVATDHTDPEAGRIRVKRLLGWAPDQEDTAKQPAKARIAGAGHQEVLDPRAGVAAAALADDETAGLEESDASASLNLARTDENYDTALTDAWKDPGDGEPAALDPIKVPVGFDKLTDGTFADGASGDDRARFDLIKGLLEKITDGDQLLPPYVVTQADASLQADIGELEERDEVIGRYRRLWNVHAPENQRETRRLWIVHNGNDTADEKNNGTHQLLLLHRIPKRPRFGAPSLERSAVETKAEQDGEMASGLFLAELLELLRDQRVTANEGYQPSAADTALPGEVDEPYRLAPYLRLVLEFEEPDSTLGLFDPVPGLIALEQEVENQGTSEPVTMTLGGKDTHLVSVLGPRDSLTAPPEYDLFPGSPSQSAQQVGLTWRFLREDSRDVKRAGNDSAAGDPFLPYQELEKFVVTRTNLSRPADRPRTVDVLPAWFVADGPSDGTERLVKPQFQFVDDDLRGVLEGDLLQYRVVAEATDRPLASFLVNVRRRTLAPLDAIGQVLALHWIDADLNADKGKVELVIPYSDQLQDLASTALSERKTVFAKQLRLRYRLVAAPTVGSYGFELRPPVRTRLVAGVPSRGQDRKFPDVRFAESEASRTVPWVETNAVAGLVPDWKPVTTTRRDPRSGDLEQVTSAFRVVLDEQKLRKKIETQAGQAVELYVGREQPRTPVDPLRRSPLNRCRHAVTRLETITGSGSGTPTTNLLDTDSDAERVLNLERGNSVDAIEWLPTKAREPEYLRPGQIKAAISYPPPQDEGVLKEGVLKPETPSLGLQWSHDQSRRGMAVEASDKDFEPVVGYRIHRFDQHDPNRHIDAPADTELAAFERAVTVVPEALYRSQPDTIEVLGLKTVDSPTPASAEGDEQPETIDELVTRLTGNKAGPQREAIGLEPRADWLPIDDTDTTGPDADAAATATHKSNPPFPPESRITPTGPVWLHNSFATIIDELASELKATAELGFAKPLQDASRVKLAPGETAQGRFNTLIKDLGAAADPYGWLTAEALGRSAECRFLDSEGRPIPAERVTAAFKAIAATPLELEPETPAVAGPPAVPAVTATYASLVQLTVFLAEDERTPLDVVRLVLRPPLENDPAVRIALSRHLRLPIPAGNNEEEAVKDVDMADFLDSADGRLNFLNTTAALHLMRRETRGSALANAAGGDPQPEPAPTAGTVTLPIDAQGRIRLTLPIPDNWAHDYRIALEPIRRYDRVVAMLNAPKQTAEAQPPQAQEPQTIPANQWHAARVDRTRPLVKHNLIATPLPGSIQALLFRHPAAFAATSNAANAAYGQYSGQTIAFERRIAPELKERLDSFTQLSTRFAALDWDNYQTWLDSNGHEAQKPGPVLVARDGDELEELALEPVAGTEAGVYGADRYVLPDLPGYYEYRAKAYSTAGRRTSEATETGWVAPLYDSAVVDHKGALEAPARQPPRTVPVAEVDLTAIEKGGNEFTVELLLIHPRFHLREAMRPLWVESDRIVKVGEKPAGNDIEQRLGSLPDLALSYQLFFWENFNPEKPTADPVYVPLARVLPPTINTKAWFTTEAQFPGLTIAPAPADEFTPTIQADDGSLRLQLTFSPIPAPAAAPPAGTSRTPGAAAETVLKTLRDSAAGLADSERHRLFPLCVERDGVRSELQPKPPTL